MADKNRMSLREGKVFVDGEQILDLVKCEIYFTPEVVESRSVGQKGKSRRYLGYDITGNISEYKIVAGCTLWIVRKNR